MIQAASNLDLLNETDGFFHIPPISSPSGTLMDRLARYREIGELPAKFSWALDFLAELKADDRKVVVWTSFIRNIDQFARLVEERLEGPVYSVDGRVLAADVSEAELAPDELDETREARIDQFLDQDGFAVLVANPAACAESISLHSSCYVAVYLDRTHDCARWLQSIDRIHRLGLPDDIEVEIHVAQAMLNGQPAVDVLIDQSLTAKSVRMQQLLNDAELRATGLADQDTLDAAEGSEEDLDHLLRYLIGEESAFNSRTEMVVGEYSASSEPVVIELGADIDTPAGHLLATSLANLLARAHQRLVIVGDLLQPLLCPSPFGHADLQQATAGLAREIHPWREIEVVDVPPQSKALISIGLGQTSGDHEIQIGADGWVASFGSRAGVAPDALPGAALATCLAADAAFRRQLGRSGLIDGQYTLWGRGQPGIEQGPPIRPIDVGSVLQVGAGAVGAALDWWLSAFGFAGAWTIADGDAVEISNLNRQMLYVAADTEFAGEGENKATLAATRMIPTAAASPRWYGDDEAVVSATYDVVLPLANERAVRPALQARVPPLLLHATTSRHWQGQLHRHVPGRDDCLTCRIPTDLAQTTCAEGTTRASEPDAALPFLSATAGLLLAAELSRLSATGHLDEPENVSALDLSGACPVVQRFAMPCREGCASWPSPAVRRSVNAGTRWAELDPAARG